MIRSPDWIATEYINQSAPAAFYTLYPENAVGAIPSTVTLYASQFQQFAVSGSGACSSTVAVTWTISPADAGTINTSGLYTAPSSIVAQQTVTATATSRADNSTIGNSESVAACLGYCHPAQCNDHRRSDTAVYGQRGECQQHSGSVDNQSSRDGHDRPDRTVHGTVRRARNS